MSASALLFLAVLRVRPYTRVQALAAQQQRHTRAGRQPRLMTQTSLLVAPATPLT